MRCWLRAGSSDCPAETWQPVIWKLSDGCTRSWPPCRPPCRWVWLCRSLKSPSVRPGMISMRMPPISSAPTPPGTALRSICRSLWRIAGPAWRRGRRKRGTPTCGSREKNWWVRPRIRLRCRPSGVCRWRFWADISLPASPGCSSPLRRGNAWTGRRSASRCYWSVSSNWSESRSVVQSDSSSVGSAVFFAGS